MSVLKNNPESINITLSIVIISRNEAQNIACAIESVLRAIEHWPQTEIMLVDSASNDETVEIAKRYPINIVRLKSSWFLSAAAGRYIGTRYTKGDLIQYMDGDMELDPKWLDNSIPYALENPQAAAIGGYGRDVYMSNGKMIGEVDIRPLPQERIVDVRFIGGAMLCRRSALIQVGGFQPFIKSEEEVDMCMRLRYAGYKVVRLPFCIYTHYCVPPQSLAYSLRRLRLDMWLGFGQVPRNYWGTGLFWMYLKERGSFVVYLMGILLSLITLLITIFSNKIEFFGVWMIIVAVFILVFIIKKGSFRKTLVSFIAHTGITVSAVRGFLMPPRSRAEYPTDPEIIQLIKYQKSY